MSGTNPAHIQGSVVNSIAHQSLRYLRQKAVDEYWAEQARALAEKRAAETEKPGKARVGTSKKTHVSKSQIENAMFALLTEFKSLGNMETEWSPNENMPLPHPTGSRKQFAERAGIPECRFRPDKRPGLFFFQACLDPGKIESLCQRNGIEMSIVRRYRPIPELFGILPGRMEKQAVQVAGTETVQILNRPPIRIGGLCGQTHKGQRGNLSPLSPGSELSCLRLIEDSFPFTFRLRVASQRSGHPTYEHFKHPLMIVQGS
jgi:hypothetical protein